MAAQKGPGSVEALVLCIDRDDDLGRKAGIKGPVIGEKANLEAAQKHALVDPEDSDLNAIYAAVKLKREAEKEYSSVEVVTITGDVEVGIKSDRRLGRQLEEVIERFSPKGVILVSDGAEDDVILPLVQGHVKIISKKNVAVKQAQQLEGAYFKIVDFFANIGDNPKRARTLLGIPGLLIFAIVVLSLFRLPVLEVIFALIGVYFLAKGFGFDHHLFSGLNEAKNSIIEGKVYRLFTAFAILIVVMALVAGYLGVRQNLGAIYRPGTIANPSSATDALFSQPFITLTIAFVNAVGLLAVAGVLIAVGFILHNFIEKKYLKIKKYIYMVAIIAVVYSLSGDIYWSMVQLSGQAVELTIPDSRLNALQDLAIALLVSIVALVILHYMLKIVFFDYVERRRKLEKRYLDKEVYSEDGKQLGQVKKIEMLGSGLKGIYLKKKFVPAENIKSKGKLLVVEESEA